jgi:colanic acid/amylovoran biosynthesis glycosyltransferase
MKVAFATSDAPGNISGVSTFMQQVLPLLQDAGIAVEVHVMGDPGPNCTYFEARGISVRRLPWQQHLPYAVRAFLRLLEEGQPDVYVPNCVVPAYFAAGHARRSGIPTVGILHSDDPYYWGMVDEFIEGRPEFRLSAVVPVSAFLESEVSSTARARGVGVRRIGYGVPLPNKSTQSPDLAFRLVYMGRLIEEQKRSSDVAVALCEVARRNSNLEAWIVGDGPARKAVEDIIEEKGVGTRVRLLGRVDNTNVFGILAQCHGLVLLSDYEGLPISMLEAMATGVVPICLDMRSGIREAVQHGVNGLIVKDRAEDFFTSVEALQGDLAWWKKLSIAARETISERYSIENCSRQWVNFLQSLDRGRAAPTPFKRPWVLQLPPPNPKFGIFDIRLSWRGRLFDIGLSWKRRLTDRLRSIPTVYRMMKTMRAFRT